MKADFPITSGEDAIDDLIQHCRSHQFNRFLLVGDQNTYAALGQRVQESLEGHGWDVRPVILEGPEVVADEKRVFDVLFQANGEKRVYLAAGSGTITDITRYASFCAQNQFISLPTAPSVDAYTSGGAALVVDNFKQTAPCHAPAAVFADLQTLCEAPRAMIASGFGDILGKYISLADWELGRLLLGERYSPEIAGRLRRALRACVEDAAAIGTASADGIHKLMAGLLESGLCMAEFGTSRPASGSEHHFSHFWEMKLLQEHRPAILHGAKVGVGTVMAARRYEHIRSLTQEEAVRMLSRASLPSREHDLARIRAVYGRAADRIIADHAPFLDMLEAGLDGLKQKIADHWAEIQEIAATVPPARRIVDLLELAGGPSDPRALGLSDDEVEQAREVSHYLRARFTVNTLGRLLGAW